MFCKTCGRLLEDGDRYCPICGTLNEDPAATGSEAVFGEETPYDDGMKRELAGQILKWGILSLAFADTGCLSLLGFIFSFSVKSRVEDYIRRYGRLEGRARVGHILGRVGFGLGLGLTVFFAIYISIVILALALSA